MVDQNALSDLIEKNVSPVINELQSIIVSLYACEENLLDEELAKDVMKVSISALQYTVTNLKDFVDKALYPTRQGPGKTKSQTKQKSSGTGSRIVYTQKEVAENLDRCVRSIAYYKKDKGMPVRPDGTYDLDEIDEWWSKYRQKDTPS